MPPREALGLLTDVVDAAEFMQARARDLTIAEYLANEDLQVIFERKFEIIGEALNQLGKRRGDLFARIRHAQDAVDFRNVIIHGDSSTRVPRHNRDVTLLGGDRREIPGSYHACPSCRLEPSSNAHAAICIRDGRPLAALRDHSRHTLN